MHFIININLHYFFIRLKKDYKAFKYLKNVCYCWVKLLLGYSIFKLRNNKNYCI